MINRVIILAGCGLLFTELHSVFGWLYPKGMLTDASSWFIFSKLPRGYITAGWWLYEVEGLIKYVGLSSLFVWLAQRFSNKLFIAALVVLVHSVFTLAMFICFYKKPFGPFWVMAAVAIGLLYSLIIPEKKWGKVISMH